MFQVCLTGANAHKVMQRLNPKIDAAKVSLSLIPEDCQAEFIFGLAPAQCDAPFKKIHFLHFDELHKVQEEVKIWPDSQDLADQLLLTTIHGIWFEYHYQEANRIKLNAEARLKAALINNSDILTLLDASGKVIFQSASINQKMGYAENELEGKSLFEIIHPDDIALVMAEFRNAMELEGVSKRLEFRLRDKNGEYLYLEAIGNNQLQNPLIQAFVVHSHDISDRKREEKEKNFLIQELSKQNSELKQFAYITTHNLRAPFTNLQALIPMINANKPIPEDVHEALNRSMNLLEETLEDLIQLLFIREKSVISIQPVHLLPLLTSLIHWLNPLIQRGNAHLDMQIPQNATVPFYEPYLREILEQLIKNALQFRHPDRNANITIRLSNTPDNWLLQVVDNGLGFDYEKVKERLFGFYQRFHTESTGKGIGLLLAQTQAKACHSQLICESKPGIGSIFTLKIPH